MIVTVTGGRDYQNRGKVFQVLDSLHEKFDITLLVNGGCTGADHLAVRWARGLGVPYCTFPANFDFYGGRGGPMRNRYMLRFIKPGLVVAFPGGQGTSGCVKIAEEMGLTVIKVVA